MTSEHTPPHGALPSHHANAVPLRRLAAALFEHIAFGDATLDRALSESAEFHALNTLDRALVRMILTTTIRRIGQIDDIIRMCMNGADAPTPRLLQSLLRVAVAQIVFMNVPDHAAVNMAVTQAEQSGLARQKGLVNAVLRRAVREGKDRTTRQDIPRLNIPGWILDEWEKSYGRREALAIAKCMLSEAPLDVTLKNVDDTDKYASLLGAQVMAPGLLRIREPSGAVHQMPGYDAGDWWIQDLSASMPVRLMGDIAGKNVIDICAAPGGKTAQLVAGGAHVTALDRSPARLEIMRRNLERLGYADRLVPVAADGATWQPDAPADIVLIDAPCTATGTLRRNPDIILHREHEDVMRMSQIQSRLLVNAGKMIPVGGLIVYAVCSLQPGEGDHQMDRFLKLNRSFALEKITADKDPVIAPMITPEGYFRALPTHLGSEGGIDGFFIALLRKVD